MTSKNKPAGNGQLKFSHINTARSEAVVHEVLKQTTEMNIDLISIQEPPVTGNAVKGVPRSTSQIITGLCKRPRAGLLVVNSKLATLECSDEFNMCSVLDSNSLANYVWDLKKKFVHKMLFSNKLIYLSRIIEMSHCL